MANFLLVYHGGDQPTPDETAKVMDAWMGWFGTLGAAVVDGGNPISQVRTIASDGTVTEGGVNVSTGYSVLAADSIDAAVEMAKGCPHLASGGTVEVAETFNAG